MGARRQPHCALYNPKVCRETLLQAAHAALPPPPCLAFVPLFLFFFLPFIMLCNAETNDVARPTSSSAHCAKKYLPDAQHVSSSSSGGGVGRGAAAAGEVLEAESRFVCKLRPARLHELYWQPSASWHKRALNVRTSLPLSLSHSLPASTYTRKFGQHFYYVFIIMTVN